MSGPGEVTPDRSISLGLIPMVLAGRPAAPLPPLTDECRPVYQYRSVDLALTALPLFFA